MSDVGDNEYVKRLDVDLEDDEGWDKIWWRDWSLQRPRSYPDYDHSPALEFLITRHLDVLFSRQGDVDLIVIDLFDSSLLILEALHFLIRLLKAVTGGHSGLEFLKDEPLYNGIEDPNEEFSDAHYYNNAPGDGNHGVLAYRHGYKPVLHITAPLDSVGLSWIIEFLLKRLLFHSENRAPPIPPVPYILNGAMLLSLPGNDNRLLLQQDGDQNQVATVMQPTFAAG